MSLLAGLKLLIVASIVLGVFSLALRAHAADIAYLFRHRGALLRALLAMFVVVPAIALAVVLAFELKPGVEIALLVLSLSPVPPLLPGKQHKSGGGNAYITGLLVSAALFSLVAMPVGLHLFGSVFGRDLSVSAAGMAKTLAITIAAPMLAGFIGQKLLGGRADAVSRATHKISTLMLLAGAVALLVVLLPAMERLVGGGTVVALLGMILAGLGAGYLLGGPSPSDRAALALAAATRHPGVALSVVGAMMADQKQALIAILMSVVLNFIVGIPLVWLLRRKVAVD